jgi:xanthosine utilization system XapX-like protein
MVAVIQASAQAFVALLLVGAVVAVLSRRLPVPFVVMVAVLGCAGVPSSERGGSPSRRS